MTTAATKDISEIDDSSAWALSIFISGSPTFREKVSRWQGMRPSGRSRNSLPEEPVNGSMDEPLPARQGFDSRRLHQAACDTQSPAGHERRDLLYSLRPGSRSTRCPASKTASPVSASSSPRRSRFRNVRKSARHLRGGRRPPARRRAEREGWAGTDRRHRLRRQHRPAADGLITIAAAAPGLLLIGIHNAWDTVTYVVVASARGDATKKD